MFFMYAIFAPLLISLCIGSFLLIWSGNQKSAFGKYVGGFVIAAAALLLIFQAVHMSRIWQGDAVKKEIQKMMHQMPELNPQKNKV